MSKFKIISDLDHGSLFNRNINLEVAFNFQELGIAENIRPTAMPFSWKKATNFGFIYELSNSKKNAVWEGLYSAANPSIKKQYYENFVPDFRKRVSNTKDYINNSSKKSIGFWQKLYNTILFQQTLEIIDQEFKKFDYLLRDLHVNTDQLKGIKLLWISSYSSTDRFGDLYNHVDLFFEAFHFNFLFDYDKLYFSISPLFFKTRNLVNKLKPSDADLNSQYYEELLNKDPWSSLLEKNKPDLVLKPQSILDFQLSSRREFLKNKNLRKTISDLFDDVEKEFPLIIQFAGGLNLGKQAYASSLNLHLYSLSLDLQDRLISETRLNDLDPEPYLDRLINLMLQNPNWSKDQILEYSNNNFKYSELKKREEYFNYIKKKLDLNEKRNDDTDTYIDLSAYKGVSKLNQPEQEIKIQEFNQKILTIFTKNKPVTRFDVNTLSDFLNHSFLELEDRVFLNNLLVKFALNENNFKQIFSGEADIESNSFILAQHFILTFFKNSFLLSDFDDQTNIDQAFLDLNRQLQDQYLDYLKSLIYEKEWQILAEYFDEIRRACKNTSLFNQNFSLFSNFTIIQELQNYLNTLNISDINQDISGFRPGIHFAPETINFSVSTQLRWFFELANGRYASAIDRTAGEEYYFGTNEVEANLLKPLIIYELKFVEEKSKNLQGVDLYNFLEKNFPPLQTKNQILEEIATKLFQELPFNEAYDFLKQSLENGHNHYTHFFLENHVKTLEEYKIISEDQSLNQSLGSEQKSLDRTVVVDTLVSNYITNMNETDLLEFFEASIKGDHEKVKYYLAKYYSSLLTYDREFGSLQAISRLASYLIGKKTSIFVDENGNLSGPGLTSFLTFEEFVASFYNLSKLEKTAFIAKLLSEKLLLNEDNHLKIATFLTDQLEDSEELNLKPLLKNIISSTLSQVEGSTRIELGISRALADSFLQGNPRAVSNNYAVETIISENLPSDVAEDYREKVRKMLTNLFNQDKNIVINKNSNYQFVFDLNAQFENIALRSLKKFGIKREPIQNLSNNGKIQTGQFIVELAKSLGSLGVRFLQVFGQYFDLPKELQQEFLSVYDNASNLYMANLFQSAETAIDSLQNPANAASQEEIDYNLAQAKQLKELLPNIRIIKKIGGGSINTTYLVEIRNPTSDEITLKVLKISNPNVIIDVAETRTLVDSVVNDLQKLDKRNKKNYEVVQRLINTLEQWNTEDIQDKNFLSNDLLFNQLYPYQSRFGFAFNTSNKHEIYNRWIKIEDYVEGDTLKNLIANYENELISENHHANNQDNERAKRIEELISDIVTDYVKHLNYPVTLADGKTAYILHSDLHIGNIMADEALSNVSVIDRSYYLVLSQEEVDLIKILLSNQETDFHKFVNLTRYLLNSNQVRKSGLFNYWKAYASYLRVALKEKLIKRDTDSNSQISFFNAMMQETDRLKLEFPLNMRLFVKNMAAINRMLLRIGNDHLSDYINGTEKTIYDGKSFLESIGLDVFGLESFETNSDNLNDEEILLNSLYEKLKNQIVFNPFSFSFLYT